MPMGEWWEVGRRGEGEEMEERSKRRGEGEERRGEERRGGGKEGRGGGKEGRGGGKEGREEERERKGGEREGMSRWCEGDGKQFYLNGVNRSFLHNELLNLEQFRSSGPLIYSSC